MKKGRVLWFWYGEISEFLFYRLLRFLLQKCMCFLVYLYWKCLQNYIAQASVRLCECDSSVRAKKSHISVVFPV